MEKSDLEEEKKRTEVKNGRDPPKGTPISTSTTSSSWGGIILRRYIDSLELYLVVEFFFKFLLSFLIIIVIEVKHLLSPIFMLCQRRTVPGEDPLPERLMVILT